MDTLREAGNALLDFVYPPVCYLCRRVGAFVCDACVEGWPVAEPPVCAACGGPLGGGCQWCGRGMGKLDGAGFACVYDGAARGAVHLLKYRGKRRVAPAMAGAMAVAFHRLPAFRTADAIVPVALHASRLRARGYNQSDWLCIELAEHLGLPIEHWLERVRDTGSQVGLTAERRTVNMRGAFEARPDAGGRRILLVDDVATTGATAKDAARALKHAGAASVHLLTFARDL